jgi:hypothetical protein
MHGSNYNNIRAQTKAVSFEHIWFPTVHVLYAYALRTGRHQWASRVALGRQSSGLIHVRADCTAKMKLITFSTSSPSLTALSVAPIATLPRLMHRRILTSSFALTSKKKHHSVPLLLLVLYKDGGRSQVSFEKVV